MLSVKKSTPIPEHAGGKTYLHKRRIVFTGLTPHLSGFKLMSAIDLWETKYADQPSTVVQHFVHDLGQSVDRTLDIHTAHLSLVRTASLPESKLCSSQKVDQFIRKFRPSHQLAQRSQADHVLERFINGLLRLAGQSEVKSLSIYVRKHASEFDLDRSVRQSLGNWISIENQRLELPNTTLGDLRKVVNLYYSACCKHFGSSKADDMMRQVSVEIFTEDQDQYAILTQQLLNELVPATG